MDQANLTIMWFIQIGNSLPIMLPSLSPSLLRKNLSKLPNSCYQRKVTRKKRLLKKFPLSSSLLTLRTFQIKNLWNKLLIYWQQESNMHGMPIQEKLTLWNIPRNGGMKTVIELSINTENQEALKIRNCSRRQLRPLKNHSSTSRSRRSPTRAEDPENLWIGLASANCQLWKQSNMTINLVFHLIACETLSTPPSTPLFITKSISVSWIKLEINKLPLGPHSQRKNSRLH